MLQEILSEVGDSNQCSSLFSRSTISAYHHQSYDSYRLRSLKLNPCEEQCRDSSPAETPPLPPLSLCTEDSEEIDYFLTMPQHQTNPQLQQSIHHCNVKETTEAHNSNLHNNNKQLHRDIAQIERNVHFNPVVSKLRYPRRTTMEQNLDSSSIPKCIRECDKKSPFHFDLVDEIEDSDSTRSTLPTSSEALHRVKVHMQEITIPPVQHTVQKIQVCIPKNNGIDTERLSFNSMSAAPQSYKPHKVVFTGGAVDCKSQFANNGNSSSNTTTTDFFLQRLPAGACDNDYPINRFTNNNSTVSSSPAEENNLLDTYLGRLSTRVNHDERDEHIFYGNQAKELVSPPTTNHHLAAGTADSVHGLVFSAFDSNSFSTNSCSPCKYCDNSEACGCIMRAPAADEAEATRDNRDMPVKINNLGGGEEESVKLCSGLGYERGIISGSGEITANGTKNVYFGNSVITHEVPQQHPQSQQQFNRNINSIGSLECIHPLEEQLQQQVIYPRKKTGSKNNSEEEDNEEKGHSWRNAYSRKGKSKPKLSLFHRLTFGKFINGSSGKNDDKNKNSKKVQKRSSCPPLGHPLLLHNLVTANERRNSNGNVIDKVVESFNGDVVASTKQFNDLNNSAVNSKKYAQNIISNEESKLVDKNEYIGEAILDKYLKSEETDKENEAQKLDYANLIKELPPKPTPRKKHLQQQHREANGTDTNGRQSKLNSSSCDPDEFSLQFEEIMEGIWDLEPDDTMTTVMEQKALFYPSTVAECGANDDETAQTNRTSFTCKMHFGNNWDKNLEEIEADSSRKRINGGSQNIPEEGSSSNSVVGKPPKPPITARQIGMRTGAASERFSYLKGRMNATATTETRLAMELAAKLCEFREELHRSREQIANFHPNLDEMESLVRTTLAIDRAQRILPSSLSRNSTARAPLPTTTATNSTIDSTISTSRNRSSSSSAQSQSTTTNITANGKLTSQQQPEPVLKSVTEIIKEEWESVVLRAKENFSRSSFYNHHHHQQQQFLQQRQKQQQQIPVRVPPNNNGESGDPCCYTLLLESDLDTAAGAVWEFPVDNSFRHGDPVRLRDLEKVLKVEGLLSTSSSSLFVPKNSCSLQNLSCGGPPEMATLKPGDPGGGGGSGTNGGKEDRSRSMEFLIDESNKNAHLLPPENTLMKNQETRRMSEHELRIQRSLQKLNVPDWYKNYAPSGTVSAAVTPNKSSRDFGSGTGLAGGWPGLSTSKTNSLTSLQSAGRYAGSKSGFGYGRHRSTGTASTGGRSSRESLMSPSSTASASPSPNFERSSFTYGMPYALTRFAAARMSCGASPASLSPSPSPVGGIGTSTSTPVSSGPTARYGYQKQPYLGWRSQERLASKSLYRSPAERLAADIIAQKVKPPQQPPPPVVIEQPPPPTIEIRTSPKKETASSDLSLNNSEESNSHKLNRVRSSIKEVSNAIVDYVNETKPLDDGMNGRASPRRGLVWLESSFVGTKPIDSPGTPDTPSTFMSHRGSRKDTTTFRFDDATNTTDRNKDSEMKSGESSSTSHYTSYLSRNEQMEERSNSSSVSSPTLEDILDSLLALRRPNKKFRSRGKGYESTSPNAVGGGDGTAVETERADSTTPTSQTPIYPHSDHHSTRTATSEETFRAHTQHHHHQYQPPSTTTTYQQYQYEPSTTATSEIYSTTTPTRSSVTTTTKYGFQSQSSPSAAASSDWQERMNQPLADSTFISGESETLTLTGSRTRGGTATGASSAAPSSATSSSYNYSSNQINASSIEGQPPPISSRYSSCGGGGASVSGTPTSAVNEYGGGGGRYATTHSASSSIHSTPTHQPYQSKQQQSTNQSTVASSKDYHHYSSPSSSPAKSCLIDSTQRDENNELRQSVLRTGAAGAVVGEEDEELAFGNPTEIRSATAAAAVTSSTVAPITGGVIVNPLTGLSEYSNPPTPARHRRVSFDLDFSDKEEKSSSRSKNKDETVGGTIQCRNTKCGKTATGLEARREFKVCHNCNAYYCSRECRRAHWEKHKKTCMQSRVGAICKQIISHVKEDSYVMNQLSTTAKRGFLAKGRGCVKLFFNSPDRAERFLTGGLPDLPEPLYIPHSDMLPEEMGAQTFSELTDQCKSYNVETRFVLYTCVCVVNEVPTYGAVKWERELISRSSKLRLLLPRNFYEENQRHHHLPANPAHLMSALQDQTNGRTSPAAPTSGLQHPQSQQPQVPLYDSVAPSSATIGGSDDFPPPPLPPHQNTTAAITTSTTDSSSDNDTLILRSVPPPSSHQLSINEHLRLREVSFTNIQKHLLLRGVDLKRTYPDIFTKLCKYVEHDEPFLPVTIYPQNSQTGRQFVCVIMPESSDSAYTAATEESGQRHPFQRVETINISEQDDDEFLDIT